MTLAELIDMSENLDRLLIDMRNGAHKVEVVFRNDDRQVLVDTLGAMQAESSHVFELLMASRL